MSWMLSGLLSLPPHNARGAEAESRSAAVGHVDPLVRHPIVEVDGKVVLKDRQVLFERSRTLTIRQEIRKGIIKNAICDNG